MPLSGVLPLYDGFIGSLDGGQLKRVVIELHGLKRRFLSLVCLKRQLIGRWRVCFVGSVESLVPRSPWS